MRCRKACRASGSAAAITALRSTTAVASSSAISASGTAIRRPSFRCRRANSAPLYVEMMGGAQKIMERGRQLHNEGRYLHAQEIVNKLVQAEPQNQAAKDLLADIFEQLGYQQENPGLRNSYLAAAYELRTGIPQGETANSSSPDVVRAMSTELFLNFLGHPHGQPQGRGHAVHDEPCHAGQWREVHGRAGERHAHQHQGIPGRKPDLTLTINRSDLEQTMMGAKTLEAQIADGTAKVQGDVNILKQLASTMVDFDPRFEIMPGTKAQAQRSRTPMTTRPFRARRSLNNPLIFITELQVADSPYGQRWHGRPQSSASRRSPRRRSSRASGSRSSKGTLGFSARALGRRLGGVRRLFQLAELCTFSAELFRSVRIGAHTARTAVPSLLRYTPIY